jgi:hypothetical protein
MNSIGGFLSCQLEMKKKFEEELGETRVLGEINGCGE